jgi:Ca2+-binding EF-hand superfamily protein
MGSANNGLQADIKQKLQEAFNLIALRFDSVITRSELVTALRNAPISEKA